MTEAKPALPLDLAALLVGLQGGRDDAASPGLLEEGAQLVLAQRAPREQLLARSGVASLGAQVGGVDEGGVVRGDGCGVVGEDLQQETLFLRARGCFLGLKEAQEARDTAVGVQLRRGGQEEVFALLQSRIDGPTDAKELLLRGQEDFPDERRAFERRQAAEGACQQRERLGRHEARQSQRRQEEVSAAHLRKFRDTTKGRGQRSSELISHGGD